MNTAKFITEVVVKDPDTKLPVAVAIYKDMQSGGMIGLDSSWVEQEEPETIPSPFNLGMTLNLIGD